jgi:hypothetical protein
MSNLVRLALANILKSVTIWLSFFIDICSILDENSDDFVMSSGCGCNQRGAIKLVGHIDTCPTVDQDSKKGLNDLRGQQLEGQSFPLGL